MTDDARRVKLKGGSKHTGHTIEMKPDGTLVAELYDFSDDADEALGGDVAWGVTVARESLPRLLDSLLQDPKFQGRLDNAPCDVQLLQLLPLFPDRFQNYSDFKMWLQDCRIPFTEYTDPFA